jgi:hypothetical protein
MINLLRAVSVADRDVRRGAWQRIMGRRLSECVVGVIGCGRVGKRVIRHLRGGFPEVRILANDIAPDRGSRDLASVEWTTIPSSPSTVSMSRAKDGSEQSAARRSDIPAPLKSRLMTVKYQARNWVAPRCSGTRQFRPRWLTW